MQTDPTVFVVDDDARMCRSLSRLLAAAGYQVAEFTDPQEFLATYDTSRPGCLILDVRMTGMSGVDVQQELIRRGASLPTIMISGCADIRTVVGTVQSGAIDFLEKPLDDQVLVDRVADAIRRDTLGRQSVIAREKLCRAIDELTDRQRRVMELLVAGKTTKEIAQECSISTKTVDYHRKAVFKQLGVESVVELVHLLNRLIDTTDDQTTAPE